MAKVSLRADIGYSFVIYRNRTRPRKSCLLLVSKTRYCSQAKPIRIPEAAVARQLQLALPTNVEVKSHNAGFEVRSLVSSGNHFSTHVAALIIST